MPQDRQHRRKRSRSFSPAASKHKRSWQNEPDRPPPPRGPQRSLTPLRGAKKHSNYKSSPTYGGRRERPDSPHLRDHRRSPSPQQRKRPRSRSPDTGPRLMRDAPPPARRDSRSNISSVRPGSAGQRQRSLSPRISKKPGSERNKQGGYFPKRSPSPEPHFQGKKKQRLSSLSPPPPSSSSHHQHHHQSTAPKTGSGKKRINSSSLRRSLSPLPPTSISRTNAGALGSAGGARGDPVLQQRRVTSANKKKYSRLTLHKRFTGEDQDPFRLEENVTIAILRNPNAEPSEEVTVKRVFDSSLFKMIHKKSEGRNPIFDREEIKVWRHDENLADDPDFERRLVRVKSSTQTGKPASESLSRMSPDVIRKAFGLQVGGKSKSRSPHREPQIRLDPRPDPRYESKYRQQMEKEERRRGGPDSGDRRGGRGGSMERLDKDRRRSGGEDGRRGSGETYDLRQALERRRSDREDGSFRVEVRRDDINSSPGPELYYRNEPRGRASSPQFGKRLLVDGVEGTGRNVVFGRGGGGDRYENVSPDRDGPRSWDDRGRPFRGRMRGRGRGRGMRGGKRPDWSPDHRAGEDFRSRERDRSLERRPRYSNSPPNSRGWRGNRGGRGRGRGRDFNNSPYRAEIVSPTDIDDSFKYTQHDDRDISPKLYGGRGGRARRRFQGRSFGSNNFRGTNNRGGYRGRGFRGKSFGSLGNRDQRSPDRGRERSADREWKHDMYDSLQTDEDQPHSTTLST